jgi:hypothetical protein
MCRGAQLAYQSPEDFARRAIRTLKKKFARRKTDSRAVQKLFHRYRYLQVIGYSFGFNIQFLRKSRYKKGREVPEYKLAIKKVTVDNRAYSGLFGSEDEDCSISLEGTEESQVVVQEAAGTKSSGLFDSDSESVVEEEVEVESVIEEEEEIEVLAVDEEESEVLVQEEQETEVVVEEIEIEEEIEVVDNRVVVQGTVENRVSVGAVVDNRISVEEVETLVVVGEEVQVAIEEAEEQVEVLQIEEIYDPFAVGRVVLQGVETVYARVPIPRFIAVNLIFDTELLEFTGGSAGELVEDTGYATQPEDTGYESDSSHISDYIGAHAPSA